MREDARHRYPTLPQQKQRLGRTDITSGRQYLCLQIPVVSAVKRKVAPKTHGLDRGPTNPYDARNLCRRTGQQIIPRKNNKTGVDVGWKEPDPTPRIQEAHMVIYHILCELVEAATAQA